MDTSKDEGNYFIKNILDWRIRKGKEEYLISWIGSGPEENTWEPKSNLDEECPNLIECFEEQFELEYGFKPNSEVDEITLEEAVCVSNNNSFSLQ